MVSATSLIRPSVSSVGEYIHVIQPIGGLRASPLFIDEQVGTRAANAARDKNSMVARKVCAKGHQFKVKEGRERCVLLVPVEDQCIETCQALLVSCDAALRLRKKYRGVVRRHAVCV